MKKIAKKAWGFIPRMNFLRVLILVLLIINFGTSAQEKYPEIPATGYPLHNEQFFTCTVIADEVFLKLARMKKSLPKSQAMGFVSENFSHTFLFGFYIEMVNHVYSKKELSIEEDSDIFFKECMKLVNL